MTAVEFILQNDDKDFRLSESGLNVSDVMIEFAKLHVEAALKAAYEKATVTPIDHEETSDGSFRPIWGVDDESILTAYPLANIK